MEVLAFLLLMVVLLMLLDGGARAPQPIQPPPTAPLPGPTTSAGPAQGCWSTLLLSGLFLAMFSVILLGLLGG